MKNPHSYILPFFVLVFFVSCFSSTGQRIEKWGCFEIPLNGPTGGNPFKEVTLSALFENGQDKTEIYGFYDGHGVYKVRFMPDKTGEWSYRSRSNQKALDGHTGTFLCVNPSEENHGPVQVINTWHFAYADLTPFRPFGTTAYNWVHQSGLLQEQTLKTLKQAPFNKIRMCVFPKSFKFTMDEPEFHPFERNARRENDYTRLTPAYFQKIEKRIVDLMELGIEADIILFHPYDRWGYAKMDDAVDDFYLEYVVRRFSAYRNVWWSVANEWNLMETKSTDDWDRFFKIIINNDPYEHLRGIHNLGDFYDHAKAWVTHCSIQSSDFMFMDDWRKQFKKPILIDECRYEGNIDDFWGNLSAQEMTRRFWIGTIAGCYVGHGETYLHPADILWWSKGGILHGDSPNRIDFLRKLLEEGPVEGMEPLDEYSCGKEGEYYLYYFGEESPDQWYFELPPYRQYQVEILDTWEMTSQSLEGSFGEVFSIELPGKPYMAVRIQKSGYDFLPDPVSIDYYGNLFLDSVKVRLSHKENHTVYYTVDGSVPTEKAEVYSFPIVVAGDSVCLRAYSIGPEGEKSRLVARTFFQTSLMPAVNVKDLKAGLFYRYFEGSWDVLPDFESLTFLKEGKTTTFDILLRDQEDNYGLVFDGYIKIPGNDVYTFVTRSDDGSRILIDDRVVLDNDGLHAMLRKEGQIVLEKGYHKIQLQFFEKAVGEGLEVFWASPGMQETMIPDSVLFHKPASHSRGI